MIHAKTILGGLNKIFISLNTLSQGKIFTPLINKTQSLIRQIEQYIVLLQKTQNIVNR